MSLVKQPIDNTVNIRYTSLMNKAIRRHDVDCWWWFFVVSCGCRVTAHEIMMQRRGVKPLSRKGKRQADKLADYFCGKENDNGNER